MSALLAPQLGDLRFEGPNPCDEVLQDFASGCWVETIRPVQHVVEFGFVHAAESMASAPVLSPVEEREASRFGIHALEILAEMEEHADDELACKFRYNSDPCGHVATHVAICPGCNVQISVLCTGHAAAIKASVHLIAEHLRCGWTAPLCELKVVPL